jgi:hypothetical protein
MAGEGLPSISAFGVGGAVSPNQILCEQLIEEAEQQQSSDGRPYTYLEQAFPSMAEILLAEHERYLACIGVEGSLNLNDYLVERINSFHAAVRLENDEGGESLLIDTGAYHSLAGSEWWKAHIARVNKHGLGHMIQDKPTSIVVTGVGKDTETCTLIRSAPGALEDGSMLKFEAPDIPNSTVPALCGMETLDEHNMAPLPWSNQLVKVPKGKEHEIIWPEGTTFIQCRRAKTGHLMLPIGHFDKVKHSSHKQKVEELMAFTSRSITAYQQALQATTPSSLEQQVPHASMAERTVKSP